MVEFDGGVGVGVSLQKQSYEERTLSRCLSDSEQSP